MAKELKFPRRRTVRLSEQSDDQLAAQAKKQNDKDPAVLARELVEEGLEKLESKEDKSE